MPHRCVPVRNDKSYRHSEAVTDVTAVGIFSCSNYRSYRARFSSPRHGFAVPPLPIRGGTFPFVQTAPVNRAKDCHTGVRTGSQ